MHKLGKKWKDKVGSADDSGIFQRATHAVASIIRTWLRVLP
jgi:hypothetical protein